jgi:hypothetical protein
MMTEIHSGEVAYAVFNGVLASLVVVWVFVFFGSLAARSRRRCARALPGKVPAVHAVPAPVAQRAAAPLAAANARTQPSDAGSVAYGASRLRSRRSRCPRPSFSELQRQ